MSAVGKVVNHHDPPHGAAQFGVPAAVDCIMIRDQPVGFDAGDDASGRFCVVGPMRPEPACIRRRIGLDDLIGAAFGQKPKLVTSSQDLALLELVNRTADEQARTGLFCQPVGQSETAHKVACPHPARGVDPDGDFHRRRPSGGRRVAKASSAFAQSSGVSAIASLGAQARSRRASRPAKFGSFLDN